MSFDLSGNLCEICTQKYCNPCGNKWVEIIFLCFIISPPLWWIVVFFFLESAAQIYVCIYKARDLNKVTIILIITVIN